MRSPREREGSNFATGTFTQKHTARHGQHGTRQKHTHTATIDTAEATEHAHATSTTTFPRASLSEWSSAVVASLQHRWQTPVEDAAAHEHTSTQMMHTIGSESPALTEIDEYILIVMSSGQFCNSSNEGAAVVFAKSHSGAAPERSRRSGRTSHT